jgi:hypothetical protein
MVEKKKPIAPAGVPSKGKKKVVKKPIAPVGVPLKGKKKSVKKPRIKWWGRSYVY